MSTSTNSYALAPKPRWDHDGERLIGCRTGHPMLVHRQQSDIRYPNQVVDRRHREGRTNKSEACETSGISHWRAGIASQHAQIVEQGMLFQPNLLSACVYAPNFFPGTVQRRSPALNRLPIGRCLERQSRCYCWLGKHRSARHHSIPPQPTSLHSLAQQPPDI